MSNKSTETIQYPSSLVALGVSSAAECTEEMLLAYPESSRMDHIVAVRRKLGELELSLISEQPEEVAHSDEPCEYNGLSKEAFDLGGAMLDAWSGSDGEVRAEAAPHILRRMSYDFLDPEFPAETLAEVTQITRELAQILGALSRRREDEQTRTQDLRPDDY